MAESSGTEITYDTQFQALEKCVTPLCRMPYDKQLDLKQMWAFGISKELRNRLHKAKTPTRLSKVHPISPAVSVIWIVKMLKLISLVCD